MPAWLQVDEGVREGFLNDCCSFYSPAGLGTGKADLWATEGSQEKKRTSIVKLDTIDRPGVGSSILPISLFIKGKKIQSKSCILHQKHL